MEKFPVLTTQRLILRQLAPEDSESLFKYWSDPVVTRFMNIDGFTKKVEAEKMTSLLNLLFEQGRAIRWGRGFYERGFESSFRLWLRYLKV